MVEIAATETAAKPKKPLRKAGLLNRALMVLLLTVVAIWLFVPFTMAVLWSLVDPETGWQHNRHSWRAAVRQHHI